MNQDQKDALKMTAKEVWLEIREGIFLCIVVGFIFGLVVATEIFLPILLGVVISALAWCIRLQYMHNLAYIQLKRKAQEGKDDTN